MNKGIYIYCGPTVSAKEVLAKLPEATCLPPIRHGDIIDLLITESSNVQLIGIIDGCFENVPSIWHKEILYAISKGIIVYGASSMGALRAAELHPFGMRGVGKIFSDFKSGKLENDDEVTVLHGPEAVEYIPISEALVNIRETLDAAKFNDVLNAQEHDILLSRAQTMHYKDRTFGKIIRECVPQIDLHRLENIHQWITDNKINQKKNDAIEMITEIYNLTDTSNDQSQFIFQETAMWSKAVKERKMEIEKTQSAQGIRA